MRIVYLAEKLSYLSLLLLLSSAAGVRAELLHFRLGLVIFALSALTSLLAIGLSALFTRRTSEVAERKRLSRAAVIALPAISFFAFALFAGSDSPMIHDISTDTENPPQFSHAQTLRTSTDNPLIYNAEVAAIQRRAYPDIRGLHLPLPLTRAQQLAEASAKQLGWDIHYQQPGHIEATERSFWFGFTDDIVIRLRSEGSGSRIDLRSTSRLGQGDMGANAKRIRRFLLRLSNTAQAECENQYCGL
ncbi:DUF1499 domain-containing protein [Spongiibacter sp.]|uniref:DUF1499 domain-containing protein n=1 Tax=Spongiibacter sp. TaxID=2024860 RepID=UPI00356A3A45